MCNLWIVWHTLRRCKMFEVIRTVWHGIWFLVDETWTLTYCERVSCCCSWSCLCRLLCIKIKWLSATQTIAYYLTVTTFCAVKDQGSRILSVSYLWVAFLHHLQNLFFRSAVFQWDIDKTYVTQSTNFAEHTFTITGRSNAEILVFKFCVADFGICEIFWELSTVKMQGLHLQKLQLIFFHLCCNLAFCVANYDAIYWINYLSQLGLSLFVIMRDSNLVTRFIAIWVSFLEI